ncbi:MAG: hypothetical protein DRJ55_05820, partial [Thermoprotei archaeon]
KTVAFTAFFISITTWILLVYDIIIGYQQNYEQGIVAKRLIEEKSTISGLSKRFLEKYRFEILVMTLDAI